MPRHMVHLVVLGQLLKVQYSQIHFFLLPSSSGLSSLPCICNTEMTGLLFTLITDLFLILSRTEFCLSYITNFSRVVLYFDTLHHETK